MNFSTKLSCYLPFSNFAAAGDPVVMVAVKFEERYSRKYGSGRENYPQI